MMESSETSQQQQDLFKILRIIVSAFINFCFPTNRIQAIFPLEIAKLNQAPAKALLAGLASLNFT